MTVSMTDAAMDRPERVDGQAAFTAEHLLVAVAPGAADFRRFAVLLMGGSVESADSFARR